MAILDDTADYDTDLESVMCCLGLPPALLFSRYYY